MTKRGPDYVRQRNEKYYTPAWVTEALLDREAFFGPVVDPAAGAGHILDVLAVRYRGCWGSDIEPDRKDIIRHDFFASEGAANIVTNPPFGNGGRLGVKFIEMALAVTKADGGKVAMLLPLAFDAAKGRRHIFADCQVFEGKYILTTRIRWANLDQKKAGPMDNHAWYVWNHRRRAGDPFMRWV